MSARTALRLLADLASPRALELTLEEGARARGASADALSREQLADILRREVYRRLQLSVPAPVAKARIQEVLQSLENEQDGGPAARVAALQEVGSRFTLYFDWPESQRLRALLNVLRDSSSEQQENLLAEGEDIAAQLEQRLAEGLLAQGAEIGELSAIFERVAAAGGPRQRRLGNLIRQLQGAQAKGVLLGGELEQARALAHTLRRQHESSVMGTPPGQALPPEAVARLSELDLEAEGRELQALARESAPLLRARPALQEALAGLQARHGAGEVLGDALTQFRAGLAAERAEALDEQRRSLRDQDARIGALSAVPQRSRDALLTTARLAHDLLAAGSLATDELRSLEGALGALERGGDSARTLELGRELDRLERAAEALGAAGAGLREDLADHRQRLERGEGAELGLGGLWERYDQQLAQLANARSDLDARAEAVIRSYNAYRQLGGETVVSLGRLVSRLAEQRKLRAMSPAAREDYAGVLEQAEGLLGEARAEHEAAQEIARTFGDDLGGLLDIFDLDAGDTAAPAPGVLERLPALPGVQWSLEAADSPWVAALAALPVGTVMTVQQPHGTVLVARIRDEVVTGLSTGAHTDDARQALEAVENP